MTIKVYFNEVGEHTFVMVNKIKVEDNNLYMYIKSENKDYDDRLLGIICMNEVSSVEVFG